MFVAVVSANLLSCRSSKLIKLLSPAGYLSNAVSPSSSSSSYNAAAECVDGGPEWLIEASPGQRINITLWDFGRRDVTQQDSSAKTHQLSSCVKYATLSEMSHTDSRQEKIVCGSQRGSADRLRHVYTSHGNAVRIRLHVIASEDSASTDSSSSPRFLLHYEGLYADVEFLVVSQVFCMDFSRT